jgi:hypothetical protein
MYPISRTPFEVRQHNKCQRIVFIACSLGINAEYFFYTAHILCLVNALLLSNSSSLPDTAFAPSIFHAKHYDFRIIKICHDYTHQVNTLTYRTLLKSLRSQVADVLGTHRICVIADNMFDCVLANVRYNDENICILLLSLNHIKAQDVPGNQFSDSFIIIRCSLES